MFGFGGQMQFGMGMMFGGGMMPGMGMGMGMMPGMGMGMMPPMGGMMGMMQMQLMQQMMAQQQMQMMFQIMQMMAAQNQQQMMAYMQQQGGMSQQQAMQMYLQMMQGGGGMPSLPWGGGGNFGGGGMPLTGGYQPTGNVAPGTGGLLQHANQMVGLQENRDRAAIQQVTGRSGINPSTTPWCAAWAMNLLEQHGVLKLDGLSNRNYCPTIKNWGAKKGIWGENGQYTPKAGDAILFDWNKDGTPDHIGIVEKVANGKVYTVEGNSSNSVKKNTYALNSGSIDGYLRT